MAEDLREWRVLRPLDAGDQARAFQVRGYRVEPAKVEAALAGLPGVREAAVAARQTSRGNQLVAWVVRRKPGRSDVAGLRSALRKRLPPFMVPGVFAFPDALPRMPDGKVDLGALPDPGRQPCALSARMTGPAPGTGAVLLPLRRGNRPPVFFVPAPLAVGPVLLAYARLARRVPEGRLFLAFHPGESSPPGADLVETALMAIRAAQPGGPYALLGECAGGILAWEIARRLSAAGERVDLLALLDTPWPPDWRPRLRSRFRRLLPPGGDYLLRRASRHVRALRSLSVGQWTAYLRGKGGAALAELRRARRPEVREALRRRAWYAGGVAAIPLEPWSGHLRFIQSVDSRHEHDSEGWATLAGSIEVVRVPGDHTTYLGDHVDEVAAILGCWLGRA